jgi:hypothetical protein
MAKTKVIKRVAAGLAAVGAALAFWRWRRAPAGAGRRPDDGGGLAGVREPRRPVPPVLSGAVAGQPDE